MLEMEQLLLDLLLHRALLPEFSRDPSYVERDELLLQKPLGVLNAALAGREFLAAGGFTSPTSTSPAYLSGAKWRGSAYPIILRSNDGWTTVWPAPLTGECMI